MVGEERGKGTRLPRREENRKGTSDRLIISVNCGSELMLSKLNS